MAVNTEYRLTTAADASAWDNYLNCHLGRTFAHRWNWSAVLEKAFEVYPRYSVAIEDGKIVGILPAVLMKSRIFGRFMISLPWLDYGGPLAETSEIAIGLIDYSVSLAKEEKCQFMELRAVSQFHPNLLDKNHKYGFCLNLAAGEEEVWKSIDSKAKNQVRKAAKSGLTIQFGGVELLDEFYRIFSYNMRDLGTPVWPKSLFAEQFNYFNDDTEIALVKQGIKPIAAALLIHYQDQSCVPSASAYRKYLNLSPNNLLYWEIIKRCIQRGSATFDFGRSTLDAGTYNFKKQWVKNPQKQTWQYKLLTIDELPELNPSNPKFRLAINIWKRLPLSLANALGPKIVAKLP